MSSTEKIERNPENGHLMEIEVERRSFPTRFTRFMKDNLFLVMNVVGIVIGFLIGIWARSASPGEDAILWLGMPGELYMRILKCIILPLIVCSVIDGTASTDPRTNGKLGLVCLAYMVLSNTLGGTLGLVLTVLIRPGAGLDHEQSAGGVDTRNLKTVDIIADFIRNVFPPNMVGAALQVSQTKYNSKEMVTTVNISGQLVNRTSPVLARSLGTVNSTNILGLIVISAALGIAASQSGKQAKPFLAFFKAGAHIIFKLFTWIKWTTPLGSASLIAASLAKLDNLGPAFKSMGMFSLLVMAGNFVLLQMVVLSIVFFAVRRQNPVYFFIKGARAWLMAFGAINSAIPYPEYVRVLDLFDVDTRVIEYVLPLCITLNRCGSAFFITATCVFVAQYTGTTLAAGTIFTIGILGILSSLAVPAVNSSSVVSIVIILESMGIPTEGAIGLIMAMEWVNDRVRTTSNCLSHLSCVLFCWRTNKDGFMSVPPEDPETEIGSDC